VLQFPNPAQCVLLSSLCSPASQETSHDCAQPCLCTCLPLLAGLYLVCIPDPTDTLLVVLEPGHYNKEEWKRVANLISGGRAPEENSNLLGHWIPEPVVISSVFDVYAWGNILRSRSFCHLQSRILPSVEAYAASIAGTPAARALRNDPIHMLEGQTGMFWCRLGAHTVHVSDGAAVTLEDADLVVIGWGVRRVTGNLGLHVTHFCYCRNQRERRSQQSSSRKLSTVYGWASWPCWLVSSQMSCSQQQICCQLHSCQHYATHRRGKVIIEGFIKSSMLDNLRPDNQARITALLLGRPVAADAPGNPAYRTQYQQEDLQSPAVSDEGQAGELTDEQHCTSSFGCRLCCMQLQEQTHIAHVVCNHRC
jgi:hypothetical protein